MVTDGLGTTMMTLRSERATAVVDPSAGGRLLSLVVEGEEVIAVLPAEVVAAFEGSNGDVQHDWFRGSFPLAPWVGDLPGASFTFEGRAHSVEADANGRAAHGVVAECAWSVLDGPRDDSSLVLEALFGPEHAGGWPFDGRAVQSFTLTGSALQMRLEVQSAQGRMPAVAGYHPWFRRHLATGALASVEFHPAQRLISTSSGVTLSADLGPHPWDDLFVGVAEPPRISWPGGPSLSLVSDAPVWVYYEEMPIGLCLEPWTGSSAGFVDVDANDRWVSIVSPGKPLVLNFEIRFH